MEKPTIDTKHDSDSGRGPSDEEKRIDDAQVVLSDVNTLPPDPDAHLSPEEKAKVVCSPILLQFEDIEENRTNYVIQDRKLLWRLDIKLIPWLCLLYLARSVESILRR